ncbi:MAG: GNAT family N-acetyltransferase [Oscillospiraceae bacterium]|nr:GNAT family N-acetyltransferase [Oscillospiraceae bacterium]
MSIRKASLSDLDMIKRIVALTISDVYPHYYPKGAVDFFLAHHNESNIINDIKLNQVFLCFDSEQNIVGTVTIKANEISRLFVLPDYQGNGYGSEMLNYAEKIIFDDYAEIQIDASLSAKGIYLKKGYKEIAYHSIRTKNNDFLCYDVMIKLK